MNGQKMDGSKICNMWFNDEYPDKEMIDLTEEILTNQNQSQSDYRKYINKNKK